MLSFYDVKFAVGIDGNGYVHDDIMDEQYKKLNEVKLDTTFSGADTSGKKNFLASLVEKLQANQALQTRFFLEQITK